MSDYPVFDAKAAFFKSVIDPAMESYVGDTIDKSAVAAGNAALAEFFAENPVWSSAANGPVLYEVAADPNDAKQFIVKWTIK